ncbi:hypothetical protein KPMX200_71130 [Klebsiella pneumoniae]|nr:hypothetical protein KPMX200_71130 [Klebsiella pneumoniae]
MQTKDIMINLLILKQLKTISQI